MYVFHTGSAPLAVKGTIIGAVPLSQMRSSTDDRAFQTLDALLKRLAIDPHGSRVQKIAFWVVFPIFLPVLVVLGSLEVVAKVTQRVPKEYSDVEHR